MKTLQKLKEKFAGKSLDKEQTNHLKGGDDKRNGPSGSTGIPPGSSSNQTMIP
jgi:hypothetical protein